MISFEDFKKLDLRVAEIVEAEKVENSEKLVKLLIDSGNDEKRQIVAGIGKTYIPKELIGKQIIVVTNLEPRSLMGLESQGMLLAAFSSEEPVLIVPDKEIMPGSSIS